MTESQITCSQEHKSARVRSTPDVNKPSETNMHMQYLFFSFSFSCYHTNALRMAGEEEEKGEKGEAMRCDALQGRRTGVVVSDSLESVPSIELV